MCPDLAPIGMRCKAALWMAGTADRGSACSITSSIPDFLRHAVIHEIDEVLLPYAINRVSAAALSLWLQQPALRPHRRCCACDVPHTTACACTLPDPLAATSSLHCGCSALPAPASSPSAPALHCPVFHALSQAGGNSDSVDAADIAGAPGAAPGELGTPGESVIDVLMAANLTALVEVAEVRPSFWAVCCWAGSAGQ